MKKSKIILFICVIILATQISTAFAEEDAQILNNANEDINNKLKIHYNTNNLSADGGKFSDIRSAVENANDGDTISLSGTYESDGKSINIKKKLLLLIGFSNTARYIYIELSSHIYFSQFCQCIQFKRFHNFFLHFVFFIFLVVILELMVMLLCFRISL